MDIGATIRRARKASGLTQQSLADLASVGRDAIMLLEKDGERMSVLAADLSGSAASLRCPAIPDFDQRAIESDRQTRTASHNVRIGAGPALQLAGGGFPHPNGPDRWQITSPLAFLRELEVANTRSGGRLKPAIGLLKCWNALNVYPWASFELEAWAVAQGIWQSLSVAHCLFALIEALPRYYDARWKEERVERAQRIVQTVRQSYRVYARTAEEEVRRLIPA